MSKNSFKNSGFQVRKLRTYVEAEGHISKSQLKVVPVKKLFLSLFLSF
jgi:hypothetical protein